MPTQVLAAMDGLPGVTTKLSSKLDVSAFVEGILAKVQARDPEQKEFLQAVEEVLLSLKPVLAKHPEYCAVLERMCEPERQIMFRVPWLDDAGNIRVNRGYRVQFSSAIGPYKGGLRFHPTVSLSVIKFLGFEQCFKNALTTLPMGGGKGGTDFDPKGKSDNEVMRFCQSFMTELHRHIGSTTDVPAGDIGVGGREIGFLYGQYKRLQNEFTGVLTGKAMEWGGSNIRPEATGYGAVYFGLEILQDKGEDIKGKRCFISGSGNVAQYAAEKLIQLGAVVLTLSDSTGYVYEEDGFTMEQLKQVMEIKNVKRASLKEYSSPTGVYVAGQRCWNVDDKAHIALPCATQNEIEYEDAVKLVNKGVAMVLEGANMPSTNDAIAHFHKCGVVLAAAKACNAGGVAVSGLEMAQNACMSTWSSEQVDERLKVIMHDIFAASSGASKEYGVTLQEGANIAGFEKIAKAMIAQGCV
uniref:Glutamate dehydrogenase n=2 Tax=Tetradesmus obliquus TaxID=3088 RepID=A0A383VGJ9_TETOB|eukprot:jgi/Sobl393_1/10230/SZX68439.1